MTVTVCVYCNYQVKLTAVSKFNLVVGSEVISLHIVCFFKNLKSYLEHDKQPSRLLKVTGQGESSSGGREVHSERCSRTQASGKGLG